MRYLLVVALLVAACGQAEYQRCETACRNFVTLSFWDKWDKQIDIQPAAERAQLRRRKLAELNHVLEQGLPQCIQSCQIANNDKQNDCMIAAKTLAEISTCAESEAVANE